MLTAYHLIAARNDKLTADVRQNTVVLIDPLQNPDGRDRFVQNYRTSAGLEPDPSPVSAERLEPWPGGRSNHYLFDMNRDWFALTQPETRGRIAYLNQWLPLVFVDLHEMGTDTTYFFAPGAEPYNPHLTKEQKDQATLFGKNNAKWFDQFGYTYFTREVFDEFYPGYGASWPWYYGGMGMTYENASVRGLIARKSDDSLYTFKESVKKHFVASVATCEAASINRDLLLKNFWRYTQSAVDEGQKEAVKEYILPRRGDTSAVDKLAYLLAEQGIIVKRAPAAFRNGGKDYPAGTYVVSSAQARKRMVRTLLETKSEMDPAFVKEQERRRKKGLRDEIYDVTAWSLPMLYNVECVAASEASAGNFETITGSYQPAAPAPARASIAYVIPWGSQAAGRFLAAALRADLKLTSAGKPFTQNGRKYAAGTLVVGVKQNDTTVHEKVARIAVSSGAEVIPSSSSWVDEGLDYGSNYAQILKKPAIAMAWDTPTSSLAAGATRFVIERLYGYPVTTIRTQALAMADLSRFQVLILPDAGGSYASALGSATERIKTWVRSGGTLIGIGDALSYLASPQAALLALQQEALAVAPLGQAGRRGQANRHAPRSPCRWGSSARRPGARQDPDQRRRIRQGHPIRAGTARRRRRGAAPRQARQRTLDRPWPAGDSARPLRRADDLRPAEEGQRRQPDHLRRAGSDPRVGRVVGRESQAARLQAVRRRPERGPGDGGRIHLRSQLPRLHGRVERRFPERAIPQPVGWERARDGRRGVSQTTTKRTPKPRPGVRLVVPKLFDGNDLKEPGDVGFELFEVDFAEVRLHLPALPVVKK